MSASPGLSLRRSLIADIPAVKTADIKVDTKPNPLQLNDTSSISEPLRTKSLEPLSEHTEPGLTRANVSVESPAYVPLAVEPLL